MSGGGGPADAHNSFRSWALQQDVISLLSGPEGWSTDPAAADPDDPSSEAPEQAVRGQGYLRRALVTEQRIGLRIRISFLLFAVALVVDTANQASPLGISMPTGAFWVTIGLVIFCLLLVVLVYPRLDEHRFPLLEQAVLTFASLLIVYQCSKTGGAGSPYMIWFLLTAWYAAYLLPRHQAVANLIWFSLLIVGSLLLSQTVATESLELMLLTLTATMWAVSIALVRQRRRENVLERTTTFQALADQLTSTANIRSFERFLQQLVRQDGQHFAVLVADIDGLKGANAVFGHEVGDGMVTRMARLMLLASGDDDQVARFGGDEFAVVIPDGRAEDVARWREKFEHELARHNEAIRGRLPQISASVGAALYPDDGISADDLLHAADLRMYEEKTASVLPPYEFEGETVPDTARTFHQARFLAAPRHPMSRTDVIRHATTNWFVWGVPLLLAAVIAAPGTHTVVAAVCGAACLLVAFSGEFVRRLEEPVGWLLVADILTLLLVFPGIWATGGASSPLLVATTMPIVFYAQHLPPRQAVPRIAAVVLLFSAAFWSSGPRGIVEETLYPTLLAAILIVAFVMQYSTRQQTSALSKLRRSAGHDELTSLPNIFSLRRDLTAAIEAAENEPVPGPGRRLDPPALIVVDLDDFRQVNTAVGHRGGDEVLRRVARQLREVGGLSSVYRVDGDQFALIVNGLTGRALAAFAERCRSTVEHVHHVGQVELKISASAGHVLWSNGRSVDAMMDLAETELSSAKPGRDDHGPGNSRILL